MLGVRLEIGWWCCVGWRFGSGSITLEVVVVGAIEVELSVVVGEPRGLLVG